MKVKSEVAQWCPTLSDPMDCSQPGSSIHGILQGRALEWGTIALTSQSLLFAIVFSSSTCILISKKSNSFLMEATLKKKKNFEILNQ